jgi:hypothetical protein
MTGYEWLQRETVKFLVSKSPMRTWPQDAREALPLQINSHVLQIISILCSHDGRLQTKQSAKPSRSPSTRYGGRRFPAPPAPFQWICAWSAQVKLLSGPIRPPAIGSMPRIPAAGFARCACDACCTAANRGRLPSISSLHPPHPAS